MVNRGACIFLSSSIDTEKFTASRGAAGDVCLKLQFSYHFSVLVFHDKRESILHHLFTTFWNTRLYFWYKNIYAVWLRKSPLPYPHNQPCIFQFIQGTAADWKSCQCFWEWHTGRQRCVCCHKELSTNNCCKFMAIFIVFPGFCLKQLQQLFSDNS